MTYQKRTPTKTKWIASAVAFCFCASTLPSTQAQTIVWEGISGDGTTWGDGANWVGGNKPTASNDVQLDGATVTVDSVEAYNVFVAAGADGSIIVDNGGELTAIGTNSFRYVNNFTINSGGTIIAPELGRIRSEMVINSGGEFAGAYQIFDGATLTIGGVFKPLGETENLGPVANEFRIGSIATTGHVALTATGTVNLNLFGDVTNQYFNLDGASGTESTLDLSLGSIILTTQGGYTPMVGDSFDLWEDTNGNNTVTSGDGSNITLTGYQLDLSQWASDGIVTVVPEPSTALFSMLGGMFLLFRRRSRC